MHHIYKTRAIILNSQPIKEADKQLILLTQDFGLIRVIGQGTRKIESKHGTVYQRAERHGL